MSPWLVAQVVYASVAWWLCARWVTRTAVFGAVSGRSLAGTVRELRLASRDEDVPRLTALLHAEPLAALLDREDLGGSAEQLVDDAITVARAAAPPIRMLRSLATMGTMFGLLCAVASLRSGIDANSAADLGRAASRALDSAVVGFVTALPCWTAAALCGRRARQTEIEIESVLLALTATQLDPSAGTDERSTPGPMEPVDAPTGDR